MNTKNKKSYNVAAFEIYMSPGEMIRELREQMGLSQSQLAALTQISQTNLSAIENGRVEIGKQRAIVLAKALHVHPASIMFSDYKLTA
jgi:transcriptional regulator with XRE-family HTH domain